MRLEGFGVSAVIPEKNMIVIDRTNSSSFFVKSVFIDVLFAENPSRQKNNRQIRHVVHVGQREYVLHAIIISGTKNDHSH